MEGVVYTYYYSKDKDLPKVSLAPKVSVFNVDSSFFIQLLFKLSTPEVTMLIVASQPKNFTDSIQESLSMVRS